MSYEVLLSAEAELDLDEAFLWLLEQTPQHAPRWYNGVLEAVNSLNEHPGRCALAPESGEGGEELRQLIYGDKQHGYRIVFAIRGQNVHVHRIKHGARDR